MLKSNLPDLSQRLAQLAEALGGRAPAPAGLLVWGDALENCGYADVLTALTEWPKNHAKMPVPADIVKASAEVASRRIATAAEQHAKSAQDPWSPETLHGSLESPEYKKFLAWYAEHKKQPRPDGKAWARKLRARELAGENLSLIQSANWREALRHETEAVDEEALSERLAIQGEGA